MVRSLLLLSIASIFAMGLVMIFSTTSAEVLDHDLDRSANQALFRQIYYALTGSALVLALWFTGYERLLKYSPQLLLLFTLLLLLVLIPGIGREANGSRRWLSFAGFSFQPSEFVKLIVPAFFINRFMKLDDEISFKQFIKIVLVALVPVALIMIEPNNGTAAVIGMSLLILFLLARIPAKFWFFPLVVSLFVGGLFAWNLPYVGARLKVYFHPELDIRGKGHQPYQAKIAAGSGHLFGRGPGNSLQKLSYLPEAQNDYIAAIYAEEFGFAGVASLVVLYAVIGCLGFYIACTAVDKAALYLAGTITFLICFQAFLNLGVVSGLLPSTGLNLPFFSQGGSSLMANIAGAGILLQISKSSSQSRILDTMHV